MVKVATKEAVNPVRYLFMLSYRFLNDIVYNKSFTNLDWTVGEKTQYSNK
jgi:hypothetical protein